MKRTKVTVDQIDSSLPARKKRAVMSSTDDNCTSRTSQYKCGERKQVFRLGASVTISCHWRAQIHYHFRSLFRGEVKAWFEAGPAQYKLDFTCLPRDWRQQLAAQIVADNLSRWKKHIYRANDFYGQFDDWKVEIDPQLKLYNIKVHEIDAIDTSPDITFYCIKPSSEVIRRSPRTQDNPTSKPPSQSPTQSPDLLNKDQ